jgi:hypothetical protein
MDVPTQQLVPDNPLFYRGQKIKLTTQDEFFGEVIGVTSDTVTLKAPGDAVPRVYGRDGFRLGRDGLVTQVGPPRSQRVEGHGPIAAVKPEFTPLATPPKDAKAKVGQQVVLTGEDASTVWQIKEFLTRTDKQTGKTTEWVRVESQDNVRFVPLSKVAAPLPPAAPETVAANQKVVKAQFSDLSMKESMGGNAGANRVAVNGCMNLVTGEIIVLGNRQMLPPAITAQLDAGRLTTVTIIKQQNMPRFTKDGIYADPPVYSLAATPKGVSPQALSALQATVAWMNETKFGWQTPIKLR